LIGWWTGPQTPGPSTLTTASWLRRPLAPD
jgi:hypothetical protein